MADWKPSEMLDNHGQPYASVFEAMCDRLDPPPAIDDEVRKFSTTSYEAAINFGSLGATLKFTRNDDVMESMNQQAARERPG